MGETRRQTEDVSGSLADQRLKETHERLKKNEGATSILDAADAIVGALIERLRRGERSDDLERGREQAEDDDEEEE